MQVKELMVTEVATVERNDDLRLVDDLMVAKQVRHLPVLEDGLVVGIVTQRDLFKAQMSSTMGYGEKGQRAYLHSIRVKEVMTYPVVTASPETDVNEVADQMVEHGIGCLPIVQGDQLVGMVTKTDFLKRLRTLSGS